MKPVVGLSKRQKLKVIKIEEDEDQAREACLNVIFDMAARGEHLASILPLQIDDLDQVQMIFWILFVNRIFNNNIF